MKDAPFLEERNHELAFVFFSSDTLQQSENLFFFLLSSPKITLIFHLFIINIVRFNGFVVISAAGVCHKITRNPNAARNYCPHVCK